MEDDRIREVYDAHRCLFHGDTIKCIDRIKESVRVLEISVNEKIKILTERIRNLETTIAGLKPIINNNKDEIKNGELEVEYIKRRLLYIGIGVLGHLVILCSFLLWYIFEHHDKL